MTTYLFYIICFWCFLLFFCSLCVPVFSLSSAQESSSEIKWVQLFKENKINNVQISESNTNEITVSNVKAYFLVSTGDFFVAFASGDICYDSNKKEQKGGVLAKYISTNENKWEEEAEKGEQSEKWETQFVSKLTETNKETFATGGFAAVVHDNIIYFIALNITDTNVNQPEPKTNQELKLNLLIGKLSSKGESSPTKKIEWSLKILQIKDSATFISKLKNKLSDPKAIDCSAFIMSDGKIGLLVNEAVTNDKEKYVIGVLKIDAKDTSQEVSFVEVVEDCPSFFFQWGEKIIMIFTKCTDTDKKVKWSTDMTQWKNDVGPFYYLWDIIKDKNDFTATTIENNKNVLLFTQKLVEQKTIILWMSDGNRVKKLGVIANNIEENVSIRIVVTNKDLFFLHQKSSGSELKNIMLARNKDYLKTITETLNAWHETDKSIQDFCLTISDKKKLCAVNLPINGLVSFLSHKGNNETNWKDKYLHLDVTISKGKKSEIQNGFMFDGNGAGDKWPVGEDGNQLYNFKKYGFTLVAMVTINKIPKSNEYKSVLGVFMNGNEKKNIGVLCANNGGWVVSEGNELKTKEANIPCEQNNVYMVAMTFDNENIAVYIDWKILYDGKKDKIEMKNTEKVLYFYFGADITDSEKKIATESHVTVNKVFLYNRPFKSDEIAKLKINNNDEVSQLQQNNEFDDVEDTNSNNDEPQEEEINSEKIDGFSETLNTQLTIETSEEKGQLQSRQGESAMSINANITVLVLMFFVMFALAERCV